MKREAEMVSLCRGVGKAQLGAGASGSGVCKCVPAGSPAPVLALRPGDFYLDRGLMVFAEAYHLRRGYCCGNGCRHCPYPVGK